MTPLQALATLEHMQDCDPTRLPCVPEAAHESLTPLSLAALASLSGALHGADGWDQLCEAIEHGFTLLSAEVISIDEWEREINQIAGDVIRMLESATNGL